MIHAAIVLAGVLIGVDRLESATAVGIVGLGPRHRLGLYARTSSRCPPPACTSPRGARLATAGAIAAEPDGFRAVGRRSCWSPSPSTEVQGRLARSLRTAAATDPLTGVANRRAWEAEATRNLAHARRAPASR